MICRKVSASQTGGIEFKCIECRWTDSSATYFKIEDAFEFVNRHMDDDLCVAEIVTTVWETTKKGKKISR